MAERHCGKIRGGGDAGNYTHLFGLCLLTSVVVLYLGASTYSRDSFLGRLVNSDADIRSGTDFSECPEHVVEWFSDVRQQWTQHFHGDTLPNVPIPAHHQRVSH